MAHETHHGEAGERTEQTHIQLPAPTFWPLVLVVTLVGFPIQTQLRRVLFLSWYWHFVDAVWVIVFTVVYIIGR